MSTRKQEEVRVDAFLQEEEEEAPVIRKAEKKTAPIPQKKKKDRRYYMRRAAAVFLAALLGFGSRAVYRGSTLFLNDRTDSRYLPIEEYVLYENGKQTQNVRTLRFKDISVVAYYDTGEFTTSRDITIGDSWDAFVEAYGDVRYDYIGYFPVDDGNFYDYSRYQYADDTLTVREFDEKYVRSGLVDPDTNIIDVSFSTEYMGNEVFYTNEEWYRNLDTYYSDWNEVNRSYPRRGYFSLYFEFIPRGMDDSLPEGGLYRLQSGQNSY